MDKRTLISSNNYLTIQGWMITELGLASNSLLVYACIYGFSQDGESWFEGTREYLAEWCGRITVKTISRVLDDLIAQGLIEKREVSINHVKYCNYRVILSAIPGRDVPEEAPKEASPEDPEECQRGTKGVGTFCPHPENSDTTNEEIRQIMSRIRKNREKPGPEPPGPETGPVSKGSEGGRDILTPVGTFCPGGRDILSPHNININYTNAGNQSIDQDLQSVSGKDDRLIDGAGADVSAEDIEDEVRERIGAGTDEERGEICEMIADVLKSRKELIRIGREDLPAADVKRRFRRLTSHHVDYVQECIRTRSEKISNYRQYVLTSLFNAPSSMNGFYAAKVREDEREYFKSHERSNT